MLQEFLGRGKENGQTNLVPISGRVPVLNLDFAHGRSETAMEVVDFAVDFLVAKCKRKIWRKNPPENPPAENKKSAGARPPPKSAGQA